MGTKCLAILLVLVAIAVLADDIVTTNGKVYKDVKVLTAGTDAFGISIEHSSGAAKVLFINMTQADQVKYGYDPAKGKADLDALAKRKAEAEVARQAQLAEQQRKATEEAARPSVLTFGGPDGKGSTFRMTIPSRFQEVPTTDVLAWFKDPSSPAPGITVLGPIKASNSVNDYYSSVAESRLREHGTEVSKLRIAVSGHPGIYSVWNAIDEDGRPLTTVMCLLEDVPGRLYVVFCSALPARFAEVEPVYRQIINGLGIEAGEKDAPKVIEEAMAAKQRADEEAIAAKQKEEEARQQEAKNEEERKAKDEAQYKKLFDEAMAARQQEATKERQRKAEEEAQEKKLAPAAEASAHAEIPRVVNGLMAEWAKGNLGYQYWKDTDLASQLYAVTKWEIMDTKLGGTTAIVTVRVNSSTKEGTPIVALWKLHMSYDGTWKVSLMNNAQ